MTKINEERECYSIEFLKPVERILGETNIQKYFEFKSQLHLSSRLKNCS